MVLGFEVWRRRQRGVGIIEGGERAIRSGFLGRLSYDIFIFLGVCTSWADLECGKWGYLVYGTWRLGV